MPPSPPFMTPVSFGAVCSTACALSCLLRPCVAAAQRAQRPHDAPLAAVAHAPLPVPADSTVRFRLDIQAKPLAEALNDLARQTGLRIAFDSSIVISGNAPRLAGQMTAPAALRQLLHGTAYRAQFTDADLVVIGVIDEARGRQQSQSLERVVVKGDAARRGAYALRRSSSATRTDTPLIDVPQSVTVVGASLMADQSMQSMADVVRYVPGVTMGLGEGHRDAPTIRGQASTADFYVDGVRDDAQYLRDVYNVERVEALKGPNAMTFGRGGGGGVINRASKEAQWTPRRSLTLEGGSFDHKRMAIDVGDGVGGAIALRLNAVREDSRQFRDASDLERTGINPTMTLLAGQTMVRLGYEYFNDRRTVDRGIPSFAGAPSRADLRTFFGDPSINRSRATVHAASATVERALADGLQLRNRTRFVRYDKFYQNTFPGAVSADEATVALSGYNNATDRTNLFNQTDITFGASTGALRHTLLVGGEAGRQSTDNYRETGYFNGTATSFTVPFSSPTITAPVTFRQSATDADNRVTATVASAYAQDQVALGAHWEGIVGVRYDRVAVDFRNNRQVQALRRVDGMVSPRAGLIFKPASRVSTYGSYSVSFLPSSGDQFSALTATTETLRPEAFVNREVGLKWDPRADLSLTTALYRLDRSNTSAPSPDNPTVLVQTGRQRTTGMELGVAGHLTNAWQVAGGWATQRARIVSRTSAARQGATVPLVPQHTLSLWNRYQATSRAGAGVGVIYQGESYAAIDNSVRLPGFTRVDAALYLTMTRWLRAQVNVENVFDARYYPTSHGNNNIMPGAPRTVRFTLATAS